MDEEQVERRDAEDGLDDDLAGAEPVELFAAVQQDLEGADRQAQAGEPEPIQLRRLSRRALQKDCHPEEGEKTNRQVDVEDEAPAIVGCQPAANDRAKDRSAPPAMPPPQDAASP